MHSLFVFGIGICLFIEAIEIFWKWAPTPTRFPPIELFATAILSIGCIAHGIGP